MKPQPFHFHKETPQELRDLLTSLNASRRRVRIFLGDTQTGTAWMDEYAVTGTIGKSTGTQPIPLMIHNARSMGGGALLDHCIVKVMDITSGRTLYQHSTFNNPADHATIEPFQHERIQWAVMINGSHEAGFEKHEQAERYIEFMQGKRFSK